MTGRIRSCKIRFVKTTANTCLLHVSVIDRKSLTRLLSIYGNLAAQCCLCERTISERADGKFNGFPF